MDGGVCAGKFSRGGRKGAKPQSLGTNLCGLGDPGVSWRDKKQVFTLRGLRGIVTFTGSCYFNLHERKEGPKGKVASGIWHLASGIWHLASGIWHLASGIWHYTLLLYNRVNNLIAYFSCLHSIIKNVTTTTRSIPTGRMPPFIGQAFYII